MGSVSDNQIKKFVNYLNFWNK